MGQEHLQSGGDSLPGRACCSRALLGAIPPNPGPGSRERVPALRLPAAPAGRAWMCVCSHQISWRGGVRCLLLGEQEGAMDVCPGAAGSRLVRYQSKQRGQVLPRVRCLLHASVFSRQVQDSVVLVFLAPFSDKVTVDLRVR